MSAAPSAIDTALLHTYNRRPVVFERGEGVWLFDTDGNRYLDMLAGIAVCCLGHAHPVLTEAIREQAGRLLHVSNFFYNHPNLMAAELVAKHLGGGKVFFCNSGAEANEAAIKLARKHAYRRGERERVEIVALEGSFHGRTLGALAATMQPEKWEGFAPLPAGFVSVPPNDTAALEAAVTERTAAVLIEPIQGEAGVRPLDEAFAHSAMELTADRGALLICDEVQTGVGRTGRWWGYEHLGIQPHAVSLAKGLGGGVPVGALWASDAVIDGLQPGDHATTFGGGPLVSAAVNAVLTTIEADGLVDHAAEMGEHLRARLRPLGTDVRGKGLLVALELGEPIASEVATQSFGRGLIVNDVGPTSIRLAPPLIVSADEIDQAVALLAAAIEAVKK